MQYGGFAAIYDVLMQDVDYASWAEYIASFINSGARIAECACGTGELTVRLAAKGLTVTGLDISQDMLRVAQEKSRKLGLNIPFVCQDMRQLALHHPVDAVVCACDGVNYLTCLRDVQAFFSSAYALLKPGGRLLFDVSSRYKLENTLACNTFAEDDGKQAYIWKNNYDDESRLVEMQLSFFVQNGALYERFTETHVQRAHSQSELTRALERAGFNDICCYEAFTKNPPSPEAQRLQFAAVRP